MFNLFSILGAKIFAGVAGVAIAAATVQTVRIEGVLCRDVKVGEKPACIIQGFKQDLAVIRIDLDQVRAQRDLEQNSHQQTKVQYRAAQAEAQRLEEARLAHVAAAQKEITDDVTEDYRRRLADARARAEQLRGQALQAGAGSAGAGAGQPVPGVRGAAGGAAAAAGDSGFPVDQRLVATEQAIQLDALITWAEKQGRIDPNGAK